MKFSKSKKIEFTIPFLETVSFLDKVILAKHLALMIKAGLPIRESIATIQEQSKSRTFKKILDGVIKSIDNGQSLADSLARYPQIFNPLYISMIKVGEESGTLEENLEHLALQLEKGYELKKKVQTAMLYPSIVLTAVIILSIGLIFLVLPKFIPIFKALKIELPLTTRILIQFIEITKKYGLTILSGIAFLLAALFLISRIRKVKFFLHKVVLRLPFLGVISKNVTLSHLSRTLGTLLKSGVPLINALNITETTLGNLVYQKELARLKEGVQGGKSISDQVRKKEALFPPMVSRMLGVGEKTGNLEETLLYLGNFYEVEIDRTTRIFSTILEPILLLIMGVLVGFIALAIISPIYEITRGLHL